MIRFTYAWGYKSRIAAELAIEDMFAEGEISPCEKPAIEGYRTHEGKRRYRVTLEEGFILS